MAGPFIDPSVMLLDPQFTDRFAVQQRIQSVSEYGVVSTPNVTTIKNVLGIVLPAKPADLRRLDDKQFGQRTLKIITRFRLNDAARAPTGNPPTQRQPDYILWGNDTFIVIYVEDFARYGPGWTKVFATSIDSIDAVT